MVLKIIKLIKKQLATKNLTAPFGLITSEIQQLKDQFDFVYNNKNFKKVYFLRIH